MLSILHRELRSEARRPRARRAKLICTILGFVACLWLLIMEDASTGHGRSVFKMLTLLGFWFSFIQGVRVAAGTIADEKRDGTLALLFLTSLKPTEIIAGKFIAVALPLVQPFLAFIPALALTVLVGGVNGTEILRAITVVGTAMIFSIALGLCISSASRQNEHTGRTTLGLLALTVAAPLALAYQGWSSLRFFSPWTGFLAITDEYNRAHPFDFAASTLTLQYSSIALLFLAAYFLPRRWEAVPVRRSFNVRQYFVHKLSPERRAEILDRNPGEWLALRHGMNGVEVSVFTGVIALLALIAAFGPSKGNLSPALVALGTAVIFLLVRLASSASYPFAMARRSGATELLFSTPLEPTALVTGQVAALWKQFHIPAKILAGAAFLYCVNSSSGTFGGVFGFIMLAIYVGGLVVSIAALGMLLGAIEKSPTVAFFQTILIGIGIAAPLSLLSAPIPLVSLMVLGFAGNRLVSPDFPNLLARTTYCWGSGRLGRA